MAKRKIQRQNGTPAKVCVPRTPLSQTSTDKSSLKTEAAPSTSTVTRRATRSMTTAAAARAVFDTAELLEHIMLQVPMATILTSQRVCQQFRDIVKTSKKIQEKLFFRTNSECEYWAWQQAGGGPVQQSANPDDWMENPDQDPEEIKTLSARVNDFFRDTKEM